MTVLLQTVFSKSHYVHFDSTMWIKKNVCNSIENQNDPQLDYFGKAQKA